MWDSEAILKKKDLKFNKICTMHPRAPVYTRCCTDELSLF